MRPSGCTRPTGIKWGELAYTFSRAGGQLFTVGNLLLTIVTIFLGITEFGQHYEIRAMSFWSVGLPVHGVLVVRIVAFFLGSPEPGTERVLNTYLMNERRDPNRIKPTKPAL